MWSGKIDEKTNDSRLTNYGQKRGNTCPMHPNVRKSKNSLSKKQKIDHARSSRGINFIDPKDKEFKDLMKTARRNLEILMPAAMPCETPTNKGSRETCRPVGEHKTKYACIVETDESLRNWMEGAPHRYYQDHIAGKGMNSLSHYNRVHKLIFMSEAMNIWDAKAAVQK